MFRFVDFNSDQGGMDGWIGLLGLYRIGKRTYSTEDRKKQGKRNSNIMELSPHGEENGDGGGCARRSI
jgi:hypothetical protein